MLVMFAWFIYAKELAKDVKYYIETFHLSVCFVIIQYFTDKGENKGTK